MFPRAGSGYQLGSGDPREPLIDNKAYRLIEIDVGVDDQVELEATIDDFLSLNLIVNIAAEAGEPAGSHNVIIDPVFSAADLDARFPDFKFGQSFEVYFSYQVGSVAEGLESTARLTGWSAGPIVGGTIIKPNQQGRFRVVKIESFPPFGFDDPCWLLMRV